MTSLQSPPPEEQGMTARYVTQPTPPFIGRTFGAIFFVLGLLLFVASAVALFTLGSGKAISWGTKLGTAAFFGLPGVLLLVGGVRLLRTGRTSRQSLFSPLLYYALSVLFAVFTVVVFIMAATTSTSSLIDSILAGVSSAFLALLCYGAGAQAAAKSAA